MLALYVSMQCIGVHIRLKRLIDAVAQQRRHVQNQLVNLARGDDHISQKAFRYLPEQLLRRFLVPVANRPYSSIRRAMASRAMVEA